ncbi:hypothetical protein BurJ1DRAFT_3154 [Burkholderiales bacterium JOSHI_001]|nr:hypothetical protein BurJ1DRAFT_3154 [Burkholderiales bacterium JOSHI_001]
MVRTLAHAWMALLAMGLALGAAWCHPLWPRTLPVLLLVWTCAAWRWPGLILPVVVACLPWADLSPWTGWTALSEFDLVVLSGAAGGLFRLARTPRPGGPPLSRYLALAALTFIAASGVALARGIADSGGFKPAFHTQHTDSMAALLAVKPVVLLILLWPILRAQVQADARRSVRRLALGITLGVAVVALAVAWERLAMVGLFDFSRPYRAVGLFWEMHVGGAAIDAYLALAMPFVVWAVWAARSPWTWIPAAALAVAAGYACLTTFSRGVYAAALAPLPLLAWLLWPGPPGLPFLRRSGAAMGATALAALAVVGGYAAWAWAGAGVAGLVALAALAAWARRGSSPQAWRLAAGRALAAALVVEILAVLGFGTFLVDRLKQVDRDFSDRWAHWTQGVQLLHDPLDRVTGIGLGRLPAHLTRFAPGYEFSGALALEPGPTQGQVAVLSGPKTRRALAGQFALSQRIALQDRQSYRVELDIEVRQRTDLGLSVCELHLLYERRCQLRWLRLQPGDRAWQHVAVDLKGSKLTRGLAWAPRQAVFQVTVLDEDRSVRLHNLQLFGSEQGQLLRNGRFERGPDHWMALASGVFTPWHIDNLYLESLIERGPAGLFALALGGLLAFRCCSEWARHGLPEAAFLAASLSGAALVGLVSSVLDTGRPAFLLLLVIGLALALGDLRGRVRAEALG